MNQRLVRNYNPNKMDLTGIGKRDELKENSSTNDLHWLWGGIRTEYLSKKVLGNVGVNIEEN